MIIVDFSPVIVGAFHSISKELSEPTIDLVRHITLNTIRANVTKHKARYGEVVLAIDSTSWRKDIFKYYKGDRKKKREESAVDWKLLFTFIYQIQDELAEFYPGRVVKAEGAEADDIIGVLAKEFHKTEEILIISPDNDMRQLLKYPGVALYSSMTKVMHFGPDAVQPVARPKKTKSINVDDVNSLAEFFN